MFTLYSNWRGPKIIYIPYSGLTYFHEKKKKKIERAFFDRYLYLIPEAYLKPKQISTMDFFTEIVND